MEFTPVTLVQAEESGRAKAPSWWCPRAVQWSKKSNSVLLRSCVPWAGSSIIDFFDKTQLPKHPEDGALGFPSIFRQWHPK